jgi:hypothetical protein
MSESMKKYLIILTVFGCCCLFFIDSAISQIAPPPVDDVQTKVKPVRTKLSISQLRIAEEYGDVLDQLQDIIHDYHHYFAKINDKYSRKYQADLLQLLTKLEDGTYSGDVDKLLSDLKLFITSLKSDQEKLKSQNISKKLYKNIVGLRKELSFIYEMIKEDLYEQLKANRKAMPEIKEHLCSLQEQERTQEYALEDIEDILKDIKYQVELINLSSESTKIKINLEQKEAIAMALKVVKDLEKHYDFKVKLEDFEIIEDIELDPEIFTIDPDEFEEHMDDEFHYDAREHSFTHESGEYGMIREFIDSVDVLSSKVQIYIKNKTGNLEIEGWDKDRIYVEHNIELIGENKEITKDLLDAMEIKIVSNPKGIYVNSHIPNIEKANHQILSSNMIIKVPHDNPLICENSFGETLISDLDNGVSLNTDNSKVIIDNVNGVIKTVNNMGSTVITNSEGQINSNSSLGPLQITDCITKFNITNSYDEIVIDDCIGEGFIKNSGQITISDHIGELEIENEVGRIDITSIIGDLKISNKYQTVLLNSINGSVDVKNEYADINAFGVSGDFTASNSFGTITANDIEGSFDLTSNSGVIKLSLDNPYLKGSRILSDFGRVTLLVDSSNDYLINALTEGGIIKTDFDIEIKRNAEQSSTSFALGDGSIPIDVKGTNTTIIITED